MGNPKPVPERAKRTEQTASCLTGESVQIEQDAGIYGKGCLFPISIEGFVIGRNPAGKKLTHSADFMQRVLAAISALVPLRPPGEDRAAGDRADDDEYGQGVEDPERVVAGMG